MKECTTLGLNHKWVVLFHCNASFTLVRSLICCHEVGQRLPDANAFQATQSSVFKVYKTGMSSLAHSLFMHHNPPLFFRNTFVGVI